ncbi:glycoside hydrolase family 3 N-terminal domain-containing protein [Sphingomonas japonica]|uniref:beta-glucosidase n=1 Tax=Sphingomonas japonica TaxID=511662 RepID=A0ABX0U2C8_9SPHN|nr:glycoside hydrolase family 3 N-terminal domain-containing protein [Sphingomonas japonica]NIJ23856.1 beta-glucosidase [Sphingomonas japonica]
MLDTPISRRSAMLATGATLAWAASPARALLLQADSAATPAFIDGLIAQMTVEEKAGQLTLMAAAWAASAATALNPPQGNNFDDQLAAARSGRLTGVFNGNGAEMARRMQTEALKSRLKIPLIFAADIIHGHRTVFPMPIAEAASFEPELARRTARAAAVEASAAGIDWTFAPMVDIARDQRWGRGVEGSGEDVLLGNLFAAARVRGFQGDDLTANDAMLACAKHFAAYGAAMGGLDYNTVDVSERTLREIYFPPFEAAIQAGVRSFMASFNELSGVPATANRWLLDTVLHDEWKFDGMVVSDYTADFELIDHGFAIDAREATKLAFNAGVDMSMQSGFYIDHLPGLVAAGEVTAERLDEAVRRVLKAKAVAGLFDDPFRRIDPAREKARSRTPQALKLAREAGAKSIVLLKNEGDVLPLRKSGQRIALIGPFAQGKHDLIGPWNVYGTDEQAVDLATGMRSALRDDALLSVTDGCAVEAAIPGGIDAAVAAASAADVIVLAIGEPQGYSGEAQSRVDLIVPEAQQALAEAVAATGKPMVVLLKNGRALELSGAVLNAQAIAVTWFLGSESGPATADMLFGDVAPSARLPISFPLDDGQQPYFYAHKPTGRPAPDDKPVEYKARYRTAPNQARFAFGHGLTYGRIAYGAPDNGGGRMAWDGTITLSADVTNSGTRAAEEVVQLYTRDLAASITRPVRELKAFRKIRLAPGKTQRVTFTLRRADLEFIGLDMARTVEPGAFEFWIAPSAQDGAAGTFELVR